VFVLSGIDEILEVDSDHERFSAIVGPLGPLIPIPKREPGESLAAMIPRVFEAPDRFDPKRANARRNVAFGHGEHFCPGAPIAIRSPARTDVPI
jgi:hypothetical protein